MQYTSITVLFSAALALFAFEAQASPAYAVPCEQCDTNPLGNPSATCDITTSCVRTNYKGQYHCACRAGYKSSYPDNDSAHHYRVNFPYEEFRVFVKPGVVCDTLCTNYTLGPMSCQEVSVRQECL